jgi:hypothetical protein
MTFQRLMKALDSVVIPALIVATWIILVLTSGVRGIAAVVTLGAFLLVMFLWFTYRELRVHAAASRMAANGEPDELLELANGEITRRLTRRGRVPFHLYRSIAFEMRGDREAANTALGDVELDRLRGSGRTSWGLLHAAQRIGLVADVGDAVTAREVLERDLRPALKKLNSAGAEVLALECEARVLLAEGKLDEALPIFEKLAKNIRLGQSTRALCRHHVGRCLADRDPVAAAAAYAEAARLAPKTWLARKS